MNQKTKHYVTYVTNFKAIDNKISSERPIKDFFWSADPIRYRSKMTDIETDTDKPIKKFLYLIIYFPSHKKPSVSQWFHMVVLYARPQF